MNLNDPGMGKIVGAVLVALIALTFVIGPDAAPTGSLAFYSVLVGFAVALFYFVTGLREYLAFKCKD